MSTNGAMIRIVRPRDLEPGCIGISGSLPISGQPASRVFEIDRQDMDTLGRVLERYASALVNPHLDTGQPAAKYTWWAAGAEFGGRDAQSVTLHGYEVWDDAGPLLRVLLSPVWWDIDDDDHWSGANAGRVLELGFRRAELEGFGRALQDCADARHVDRGDTVIDVAAGIIGPYRVTWAGVR